MIVAKRWRVLLAIVLLVGYVLADEKSDGRQTNEVSDDTKPSNKETSVRTASAPVKKVAKNADLLRKLGLVKLKSPSTSHHRKRLASQSRGAQQGDSHVVVVKLPPAPHYYTHSRPLTHPFDHLGVGFFSNGRPARVSPLNLPLAEKSLQARRARPHSVATPTKWKSSMHRATPENWQSKLDLHRAAPEKWQSSLDVHRATPEKWQSTLDVQDEDLSQVHAVSYYKPKGPSKQAFHKYLAANGKLHSFYVMPTHKKKKKVA